MNITPKQKLFYFDYSPDESPERRNDGWGNGILYVNNKPFWFFNTEDDPAPVNWTWVDFLEHITEIWGALAFAQSYPFTWLDGVDIPLANIWEIAEERWSRLGDSVADYESDILCQFVDQHNLSAGWVGISLPALLWLRTGGSIWLYPEDTPVIRASFSECFAVLREICDKIAESFKISTNNRVLKAVKDWENLHYIIDSTEYISLQDSFLSGILSKIQGSEPASEFWEISEQVDIREAANENCLLAAARMTAHIIEDPATIRSILNLIKTAPKINSQRLNEISADALNFLSSRPHSYAYACGYALAEWVRNRWLETSQKRIDIEELISTLSIGIEYVSFETKAIEAIAIWGSHGPHIFLNNQHPYQKNVQRKRMTLAHELCHLLIDRNGALPAVDVLGGVVDRFIEQRANAFAAELLLPRAYVIEAYSSKALSLNNLIEELRSDFDISKSVAKWQIYNSSVYDQLALQDKTDIEGWINRQNITNNPYRAKITSWII